MQVGDLILLCGPARNWLIWEIQGIYLGALGQESVIHLRPLSMEPNSVSGEGNVPTIVPSEMIEAGIDAGLWRLIGPPVPSPVRSTKIPGKEE
jgi:hypothetical protein